MEKTGSWRNRLPIQTATALKSLQRVFYNKRTLLAFDSLSSFSGHNPEELKLMSIYMIGYDLHPSRGETYDDLLAAIPKVGTSSWHCLDSTWLVNSEKTAVDIRNELRAHVKDDDQLLVAQYGKGAAWFGFTGKSGHTSVFSYQALPLFPRRTRNSFGL